ncbi:hypothetical protein Btru_064950 [Bulinus truncatus]|nr:hypothetical protein Btru_064950 [Bulinus truncatus]
MANLHIKLNTMEFTDGEIREELARLGYRDVPEEKLVEFKKDLKKLITSERSKNNSLNSSADVDDVKFDKKHGLEYHQTNLNHHRNEKTNKTDEALPARFKENWQYRGQDWTSQNSNDYSYKPKVPGSYSLYEMPHSTRSEKYGYRYENANNSVPDDASSETDSETTKQLKRKISRKTQDGSRVIDESLSESGVAGLYEIYEKVKNLAMRDCECGKTRPSSASSEPPYRIKGVNKNPSVIKMGEPPHSRNLNRTVPFKRHQMYQKMWKMQPAIGDDVRHHVRKEVHSKMLQREDIKVFHKVFVPNPYVIPTEKPRYDLRWKVRKANALYEMPPHGFYHEV